MSFRVGGSIIRRAIGIPIDIEDVRTLRTTSPPSSEGTTSPLDRLPQRRAAWSSKAAWAREEEVMLRTEIENKDQLRFVTRLSICETDPWRRTRR